jgi:hypothetical protein
MGNGPRPAGLRLRCGRPLWLGIGAAIVFAGVAACHGASSSDDGDGSESNLTVDLGATTPDPANAWLAGVDPTSLAIGQEVVLPNEEQTFRGLVETVRQIQDSTASLNHGVSRGFHAKPHACVRGEFHVSVPDGAPQVRVGLFAKDAVYPAWVRFSSSASLKQDDKQPDTRGIAMKVMKVPGKKLLPGSEEATTQDFLAFNSPIAPSDATHFVALGKAISEARNALADPSMTLPGDIAIRFPGVNLGVFKALLRTGSFLFASENRRSLQFVLAGVLPNGFGRTLLNEQYFSGVPIAMGVEAGDPMTARAKQAAQYRFTAGMLQDGTCTPVANPSTSSDPGLLRNDLRGRLAGGTACAVLEVQLQRDPSKQLIEDASVMWRESDTPFVPVGQLILPQTDLDGPQDPAREAFCESLGFNPWNALPDHRPLGNAQRARRVAYEASREHRAGSGEPTGDEPDPE